MNSYTCTNNLYFSKILSLNSVFQDLFNDIKYVINIKKVFIDVYHV